MFIFRPPRCWRLLLALGFRRHSVLSRSERFLVCGLLTWRLVNNFDCSANSSKDTVWISDYHWRSFWQVNSLNPLRKTSWPSFWYEKIRILATQSIVVARSQLPSNCLVRTYGFRRVLSQFCRPSRVVSTNSWRLRNMASSTFLVLWRSMPGSAPRCLMTDSSRPLR